MKNSSAYLFLTAVLLMGFNNCSKFEGKSENLNDASAVSIDPDGYSLALQFFPSNATDNPDRRIWRLTPEQIENVLSGIITVTPGQIVNNMPLEGLRYGYDGFSESLQFFGDTYEQYQTAVDPIVTALAARITTACPAPPTSTVITPCAAGKIRKLTANLFREPETSDSVNAIVTFLSDQLLVATKEDLAVRDTINVALSSPYFLYRREVPQDLLSGGAVPNARVAENLAFTLTNSAPDTQLLQAVATSTEGDSAPLLAQATRLLNSPIARKNLAQFIFEWLEIPSAAVLDDQVAIMAYSTAGLGAALHKESEMFLADLLQSPTATLPSLLTSTQSYVNVTNNKIYGIPGSFDSDFKKTPLDPAQRMGILTQPSFLASHVGGGDMNIVNRGKLYLSKVLCMKPPVLNRDVNIKLPEGITGSARQRISQHVNQPTCASCHNIIDPLGYANENYGSDGAWRTVDSGQPVDASADLSFLEANRSVADSVEMIRYLNSSEQMKQCFVRQVFRYLYGRLEIPSDDPLLRTAYFNFSRSQGEINNVVLDLIGSQRFVTRK